MNRPTIGKAKKAYRLIEKAERLEEKALEDQRRKGNIGLQGLESVKEELTHNRAFKCLFKANSIMEGYFRYLDRPQDYDHDATVSYIDSLKKFQVEYSVKAIAQPSFVRRIVMGILDVLRL